MTRVFKSQHRNLLIFFFQILENFYQVFKNLQFFVQLFVYIFVSFSTGKALFEDFDDHTAKGGLKAMGEAMKRGI